VGPFRPRADFRFPIWPRLIRRPVLAVCFKGRRRSIRIAQLQDIDLIRWNSSFQSLQRSSDVELEFLLQAGGFDEGGGCGGVGVLAGDGLEGVEAEADVGAVCFLDEGVDVCPFRLGVLV